jgi:hypothetical protein
VSDGTACSDGNVCTGGDTCHAGACLPGSTVLPPGEVLNDLFAADGRTLGWDAIPGAPAGTLYDVARGLVRELPVGACASETCLWHGLSGLSMADGAAPAVGPSTERITQTCP